MSLHREKLKDAILFISAHPRVRDLGLTKLYKLLYFADVAHLREHGQSITGSEYIKYEHGPVPSRGEKCIRQLRRENRLRTDKIPYGGVEMISVRVVGEAGVAALTEEEIATLNAVCDLLGGETAVALSTRSHVEPAWVATPMLQKLSAELMMYGATEDPDGL